MKALRRIGITSLVLAFAVEPVLAQEPAPAAPRQLTVAQAREDLDSLRHALEEAHGALYRFRTRAELDQVFDLYRARLSRPVTVRELFGHLGAMIVEIGDGHSRMEPDDELSAALARAPLFPARVALEGDRLVVVSNDTPDDALLRPGMEITSIQGRPVRQILDAIIPRIPRDGVIETGLSHRIGANFPSHYWLYVDQSSRFSIEARDSAGVTVSVTVAGITETERSRSNNPVNAAYRLALAKVDGMRDNLSLRKVGDGILQLRIRSFGGNDFLARLDSLIAAANAANARAVILDLRRNGGGVDMFGAALVSHFTAKPFRYFDRIHLATVTPSFATWKASTFEDTRTQSVPDPHGGFLATPAMHPGIAEQQPASAPYLGRLVVLLDGGTFSTAADVTAVLRGMNRATFVGEESGGAYEGNTSGLNALVTLPNSRLKLKVQMFGYYNAVKPAAPGRGTIPDHVVPWRTADVFRGVDAALARAVAIAAQP